MASDSQIRFSTQIYYIIFAGLTGWRVMFALSLQEIVVGSNMDKIYVVMDFVEHDLKALMESMKNPFAIGRCSLGIIYPRL